MRQESWGCLDSWQTRGLSSRITALGARINLSSELESWGSVRHPISHTRHII